VQQSEALHALHEATRAISSELSLERVLQLIVDRVRPLVAAQYAALGFVDERGVIQQFVTSGITQEQRAAIGHLPRGRGLLGLIVRENRSFRVTDIARHEQSYGFPANHPAMTSFLGVPVSVKGRSVGNLYLTNKENASEFSEGDQRIVETFALHAGIAIENARLHERVQQLAVVEERDRIGRDLHDGVIQSIYGVGLALEDVPDLMKTEPAQAAERVERAIDTLHETIREIRNFILGLRPELAEERGLPGGLRALVEEFRHNTLVEAELSVADGVPEPSPERAAQILAVAREALSNVARHARASQVSVELQSPNGDLHLAISDDGVGLRPDAPTTRSQHGMTNMAARAASLDGELRVESPSGQGTRVALTVPRESRTGESKP
jgi:signal transduction histidine kinase